MNSASSRCWRLLPLVAALAGATLVLLAGRPASAYPQWQFSSGTSRCSQCHYSPAGGGLLTGYGRDAAGEDLSTWEGDGGFLHGAVELPKALAIGFDGRYAILNHDVGEDAGPQLVHFPMQADLQLRLAVSESLSVYVDAGYRGQARGYDGVGGAGAAEPSPASRFISREHYLAWRPAALGPYVRVGRFFAPYGLRLAEHGIYTRRDTGFNTLEETYNVSGGYLKNDWDIHLTAFLPDTLRYLGGSERGGAGMVELRLGEASALGLQARVGMTDDMYRYGGGAFGKTYFEAIKTLIQAEANIIHKTFAGKAASHAEQAFVGYLGVTFFPGRGFWITPFAERTQSNLSVRDTAINGGGVQLNWFPYPHFEIGGQALFQVPTGGDSSAMTGIAFIHYYL
jgi:hypothetical protein